MKKIFIVLLLLCAVPVFAAEWVEIYPKVYMDDSSYEFNPQTKMAKVWIKALNSEGYKIDNINGKKVWYAKIYQEFDCTGKRLQPLSGIYYDLQEKVLDSYEKPSYLDRWANVVPDSVGDVWYQVACLPYLERPVNKKK